MLIFVNTPTHLSKQSERISASKQIRNTLKRDPASSAALNASDAGVLRLF